MNKNTLTYIMIAAFLIFLPIKKFPALQKKHQGPFYHSEKSTTAKALGAPLRIQHWRASIRPCIQVLFHVSEMLKPCVKSRDGQLSPLNGCSSFFSVPPFWFRYCSFPGTYFEPILCFFGIRISVPVPFVISQLTSVNTDSFLFAK